MGLTQISSEGIKPGEVKPTNIADDAVGQNAIGDNVVINAHLQDDVVGIAELSATGTASSSTFLRGDNSWVTPTDTNTQLAFANDANNRIVTGDGSGGLNGESKLTYDGSILGQSITSSQEGITLTATGNHYANIKVDANRSGANNGIFNLQGHWDGTEVASIAMTTGDDTTNKDDGYIRFYTATSGSSAAERFRVQSDGNVQITDGNLVIGTSGHGIDFSANSDGPGTSESELFHIYEEGYWEPTTNANLTLSSSYPSFQYTRVGRLVTVRGLWYMQTHSGTDQVSLTLPFASLNDAHSANAGAQGCMFRYIDGCSAGLVSYIGDNSSHIYFYRCESGNSNYTYLNNSHLNTNAVIFFSHTYAAV